MAPRAVRRVARHLKLKRKSSLRRRLARSWSALVVMALAVGLAACGGAPLGISPNGGRTRTVASTRWVQRYGSALTHIVQNSLVFEGTPSVAACAAIHKSVSAAKKVPVPPFDEKQWKTALRDLGSGASHCEHGIQTVGDTFGYGGTALGRIVRDMAKSHIRLGVTLKNESEAVARGIAATTAPPRAAPSSRTASTGSSGTASTGLS